jgi:single-stranded-DNA-specific exonuclease
MNEAETRAEHIDPALKAMGCFLDHANGRIERAIRAKKKLMVLLNELARLKPTGQGNPGVQFCARNLTHARPLQRIGADRQHVKMWVTDSTATLEAIWWNGGEASLPVGKFDLAFAPQINEFNGRRTVQLKVLDWRAA